MAANIYEATQEYPLNPRDMGIRSLFLSDMEWVNDLNIHLGWRQHEKDKLKARKGR